MFCQFSQVRLHIGSTERAVQTDTDNIGMPDRSQKRKQRLPRKRTSPLGRQRQRKHNRQIFAFFLQHSLGSFQPGFHIQRVESRFKQDDIHAPVYQGIHLFLIGVIQIHIGDSPVSRIAHVGTHRGRLIGRSDRAGYKDRSIRMFRHKAIGHLTRQLSGSQVDIPYLFLHAVVLHRDGICIESVGSKNIGTGIQILAMDRFDHIRSGDTQQVVISFQVARPIGKLFSAIIFLGQFKSLDHRPHSPVQNQNTFFQGVQKHLFIHVMIYDL